MSDRVLVTGGAGFVGSSVVRMLLQDGFEVDVVDAFYKGTMDNLPEHENLTVFEADLTDSAKIKRVLARNPVTVIHLAAHHFIPYCIANPTETIRSNVLGTQSLLEASSVAVGLKKFVFASTAAVYASSDQPSAEDDAIAPIDIYGVSKHIGEQLVNFYGQQIDLPYACARLFNVVGPRETNPHLVPDIIEQLDGDVLQLGNLVPRRDYIFVEDTASALIRLMDIQIPPGAYNIGCGTAYSTSEVVDSISRILGRRLQINSTPDRQRAGDRPVLQSNCTKLKAYGWSPRCNLDEALTNTLQYYGKLD